jgi:hypothetical protein
VVEMIESRSGLKFWREGKRWCRETDMVKGLECEMVRVGNVETWTYNVALRLWDVRGLKLLLGLLNVVIQPPAPALLL